MNIKVAPFTVKKKSINTLVEHIVKTMDQDQTAPFRLLLREQSDQGSVFASMIKSSLKCSGHSKQMAFPVQKILAC